jgi:Lrp/AsnC family transcriptional regulator, leucine-responsive regulatory protein
MDALDRRILREVQRDSSRSAAELADLCRTTESTALRRLKRLEEDGVIRAQVALLDPAKLGRSLLIFVTVRLEREDGTAVRAFVKRVRSNPNVIQFYFVTGTPDYIILLSARTMEDYDAFLQEHLVSDPFVVMSETNVVIRPLKSDTAIPIDEPYVIDDRPR